MPVLACWILLLVDSVPSSWTTLWTWTSVGCYGATTVWNGQSRFHMWKMAEERCWVLDFQAQTIHNQFSTRTGICVFAFLTWKACPSLQVLLLSLFLKTFHSFFLFLESKRAHCFHSKNHTISITENSKIFNHENVYFYLRGKRIRCA